MQYTYQKRPFFTAFLLPILIATLSFVNTAHADLAVDYGTLPNVSEAQISPDGETLALLQTLKGEPALVIRSLSDLKAKPAAIGLGGQKARDLLWVDSDYLLVLISDSADVRVTTGMEKIEYWRWIAVNKNDFKPQRIFGKSDSHYIRPDAGELVATLPNKPGVALFARDEFKAANRSATRFKQDDKFRYSLIEVNLKNGKEKIVEYGNEFTVDWIVNSNGDPILRRDFDQEKEQERIFTRLPGQSDLTQVATHPRKLGYRSKINYISGGPTPDTVYATFTNESGTRALATASLETGAIIETVFENDQFDIDRLIWDFTQSKITGISYTDHLPQYFHLDPAVQKIQDTLKKALQGGAPAVESLTADQMKFIISASYTDHPIQYFMFDKNTKRLDLIAASYSRLDGNTIAKKSSYDYTASDGLEIPGYLTLPTSGPSKNLPLIVLPHGGPAARDDQSFDWWAFFYAANGYAVYQPNFRGSSGYGSTFRNAGDNEWGRKMQSDVSDGVRKLISEGKVDRERICIVGASYGGYAALAAATLTPDLYACAVSVNGVTDVAAMLGQAKQSSKTSLRYWESLIGNGLLCS